MAASTPVSRLDLFSARGQLCRALQTTSYLCDDVIVMRPGCRFRSAQFAALRPQSILHA